MPSEQVTAGAARGVGEVLLAVDVAAQAAVVPGTRRVAVPRVTLTALRVLLHLMEPCKVPTLVTARARRHACRAARTVGSMTILAIGGELPMTRARFGGMALRARRRCG